LGRIFKFGTMNKTLFAVVAIFFAITATAQDIVILKNGDEIKAKVESVSKTEITYYRQDAPEGPIYSVPASDVFMIKYQNGTKDIFNDSTAAYEYPYPSVSKTYAVGDWFDESGVTGIVFYVDDSGAHGLVMYPENYQWTVKKPKDMSYSSDYANFGAVSYDDGYLNLMALKQWAIANGKDFEQYFPQASHVEKLGPGWYIPAANEVFHIVLAFNGGQVAKSDNEARKRFNNTLKSHGGKKIDSGNRVVSSTEYAYGEYICVNMEHGTFAMPKKVHGLFTVFGIIRPVHKF